MHAFPKPKLLRLRFLGTPQRQRFGPAFCALPRSKQLRQPGAWPAHTPQVGQCILSPPSSQPLGFLGVQWEHCLRRVLYIFFGELISGCDPPGGCHRPVSQEDLVSNWKPVHSLVEDVVSGGEFGPCLLALAHLPPCLWWVVGQSGAGYLFSGDRSVLCSVSGPSSALV